MRFFNYDHNRDVIMYLYMNDCFNRMEANFLHLKVIEDINSAIFQITIEHYNIDD